mmetsp:Transcript_19237/g.23674  ORF Transcript_19237/g.23674 Transcript_19237/m.23674 type:complete len:441 (-) Transcript_19237:22-1344(-)
MVYNRRRSKEEYFQPQHTEHRHNNNQQLKNFNRQQYHIDPVFENEHRRGDPHGNHIMQNNATSPYKNNNPYFTGEGQQTEYYDYRDENNATNYDQNDVSPLHHMRNNEYCDRHITPDPPIDEKFRRKNNLGRCGSIESTAITVMSLAAETFTCGNTVNSGQNGTEDDGTFTFMRNMLPKNNQKNEIVQNWQQSVLKTVVPNKDNGGTRNQREDHGRLGTGSFWNKYQPFNRSLNVNATNTYGEQHPPPPVMAINIDDHYGDNFEDYTIDTNTVFEERHQIQSSCFEKSDESRRKGRTQHHEKGRQRVRGASANRHLNREEVDRRKVVTNGGGRRKKVEQNLRNNAAHRLATARANETAEIMLPPHETNLFGLTDRTAKKGYGPMVATVTDESASRLGLSLGDTIVRVDGIDTRRMKASTVRKMLKKRKNEPKLITILPST